MAEREHTWSPYGTSTAVCRRAVRTGRTRGGDQLDQMAGTVLVHQVHGTRTEGHRRSFFENAGPVRPGLAGPHYEGSFGALLWWQYRAMGSGLEREGRVPCATPFRSREGSQDKEPAGTLSGPDGKGRVKPGGGRGWDFGVANRRRATSPRGATTRLYVAIRSQGLALRRALTAERMASGCNRNLCIDAVCHRSRAEHRAWTPCTSRQGPSWDRAAG